MIKSFLGKTLGAKCSFLVFPFLFTIQFISAFLFGCGIQYLRNGQEALFWICFSLFLVLLPITSLVLPFYAKNGVSLRAFNHVFDTKAILIFSMGIGFLLSFAVLRPISYSNINSIVSLSSWGPLVALVGSLILDCFLIYLGLKEKGVTLVSEPVWAAIQSQSKSQNNIRKISPFFFIAYFLLIGAPYFFAQIPFLHSFFTTGTTKILFRGLTTIMLLAYAVICAKAFQKPLNLRWLFTWALAVLAYAIAWVFLPQSFSYYAVGKMGSVTESTVYITHVSMAISFFLFGAEVAIFLSCRSWLFEAIGRKTIISFFAFAISVVFISCLVSFVLEFDAYKAVIGGSSYKGIVGIFNHKNEFGAFLFIGLFSSVFLFHYSKGKTRYLCLASSLLFLVVAFFVRCYSGLIPMLFLAIVAFFYDCTSLWKRNKIAFFVIAGSACLLLTSFLLCFLVPSIREQSKILSSLFRNLQAAEDEIRSRTDVWAAAIQLIRGPAILIGKTDAVANRELIAYLEMTSIVNLNDYHDAFISFYTNHGIIGLLFYVLTIIEAYGYTFHLTKANKRFGVLLVFLLSSAVLFSLPESYVLFINMSALAFPFLALFFVFMPYLLEENRLLKKEASSI